MSNSPQDDIHRTVSTVRTVGPTDGSKGFGPEGRAPAKAICQDADGADGTNEAFAGGHSMAICESRG
jgi:hypothetical protein